jgi:hypothetical protein
VAKAAVVRIEAISEPEKGIWCDGCSLPSRVRILMAAMNGDRILHIGSYERCLGNCPESPAFEDEHQP